MNILFMNSIGVNTWGGGEKWMLTTGGGLRERNHRVFFAGRNDSLFLRRCQEHHFPTLPLNIKGDLGLGNIWRLMRFYREHHIDVVIANFNKDVHLAGIAARLSRQRPMVVARNGLPILHNNWRYRLTYTHLVDGMITNTQAIKDRYLSYGWLENDFIRVIHNGIEVNQAPTVDPEAVRRKFDIPDQEPVLGIFGRLVKQKQHTVFLEVAHNIIKKWPEALFLIVGDGPERERIQAYAAELQLIESVYFLGMQTEVAPLYRLCDVVLLTSEEEGQPNVVMEAMLAARPVVAFDVGGVRELIPHEEVGIVVPLNDIYLMTRKTDELLQDPQRRRQMGERARAFIRENFSVDRMIREVELYLTGLYRRKSETKKTPRPEGKP